MSAFNRRSGSRAAAQRVSLVFTALPLFVAALPGPALAQPGRNALTALPADAWDAGAAAHLLRRAGFSGSPADVQRLANMGLDAAVGSLVDYRDIAFECSPPPIAELAAENPLSRREARALSESERQELQQKQRQAERRSFEEVRVWWIERMQRSPRPLEEKMTLFWHGHFTSGMREVRRAVFMLEQNELLRKYALGNFRDLLIGISKDRAMLTYLDGIRNVKAAPNENYARELLELFTLGIGNYGEADVKAAARAFTGWGYDDEGFVFRSRLHDFGDKTFLGRTGKFDGTDIVDLILSRPECARFLSRKLLEFFVRPEPDAALVEQLARELIRNKYELRPTMRTLFRSQAFYHAESRGCLVKSPTQLLIGLARELEIPLTNLVAAERALVNMGQELMQPPNVKGWRGGTAWINTATLYNRYNVIGSAIAGGAVDPRTRAVQRSLAGDSSPDSNANASAAEDVATDEERMMAGALAAKSRLRGGPQPPLDPERLLESRASASADEVVDFLVAHLLAAPLGPGKRDQLVHYLREGGPLDLSKPASEQRVRTMVHLLCSTPEYQLH